jgi:hypothetical protein
VTQSRIQFTISDLYLFAALSFMGMAGAEWVFPRDRAAGCLFAIGATLAGAGFGVFCCRGAQRRKLWICVGVVLSWPLSLLLIYLISEWMRNQKEHVYVMLTLILPILAGISIAAARAAKCERENWTVRRSIVAPVLLSPACSFLIGFLIVMLTPSYITSRTCSNQWAAASACKGFAEAEEIYHRTDYAKAGVLQYAGALQTLLGPDCELSLVDKSFAQAEIGDPNMVPRRGYYFKVLKAQGPNAVGGAKSYVDENGNMTRGYALVAVPADYDKSGRDTFMINNYGTIFEKDLGPNTPFIGSAIAEFDPDSTWVATQ